MDYIGVKLIKRNIFILRLCGVWPQANDSVWYTIYSLVIKTILFLFCATMAASLLPGNTLSASGRIEAIIFPMACINYIIKLNLFVTNKLNIQLLCELLNEIETTPLLSTIKHIQKAAKSIKFKQNIFILICVGAVTARLVAAISKHLLFYEANIPVDWSSNAYVYSLVLLLQTIAVVYMITI